ncbi:response regulator [Vibrio sp. WXL103]|uniref:response regulator n=1 Tax=unclassified Vibrio TaxID=2614977 RepID=UPI003EC94298
MTNNNKDQSLENLSVLVVDDCNASLLLFKQQLKQIGVQKVHSATNYHEALSLVGTHRYDVILLDYHLDQSVTGTQLASIFSRRKLISRSTGLLLISSDSSKETVLTGLSDQIPHFMKKPFKPADLSKRLMQVHRDQLALRQLEDLLIGERSQDPSQYDELSLVKIVTRAPTPVLAESYILQTLISQQRWEHLARWLTHSPLPVHAQKLIAKARLLANQGDITQALSLAEDYVRDNPLAIKAIDLVCQLYTESGHYDQAYRYARLAFDKTPSLSSRAICAARLATELNKWDRLIEVGRLYAKSLSIADISWISAMVAYGQCLQQAFAQLVVADKREHFTNQVNDVFNLTHQRLSHPQRRSLELYKQLFVIGVRHQQARHKEAKKILLCAVLPFIDDVAKVPTCLLIECYLKLHFYNELWFANKVANEIDKRSVFDEETERLLQLYHEYRELAPKKDKSTALIAPQASS